MRFVVAGGGVAGLACALLVARAGHRAVVLERDALDASAPPGEAFGAPRNGIPHFQQPHAFLPRGRQVLRRAAPDVVDALLDAGAEEQDLAGKLQGPGEPGDDDLVYLWARRPLIEWALRRAVAAEPGVELRHGSVVTALAQDGGRATGIVDGAGDTVPGDVVVDALGRYRTPPGWPRPSAPASDCGAVYYCRYFRFADGAAMPPGPWLLNPRGDLGYMAYNTFRGDNRTLAVILLVPAPDRALRVLRDERAWMAAAAAIHPLDELTAAGTAQPITEVMPMGGLSNVIRDADPGVSGLVAAGDAFCHTDPAFAYGLSFALVHAEALVAAAGAGRDDIGEAYRAAVRPEAAERYELVVAADAARARAWAGERQDLGRRDGCYPLFSLVAAIAAAPRDDLVLRRTVRRIGLLDRTSVFDGDAELHDRIERIFAELPPPPPAGPPRDELLARL